MMKIENWSKDDFAKWARNRRHCIHGSLNELAVIYLGWTTEEDSAGKGLPYIGCTKMELTDRIKTHHRSLRDIEVIYETNSRHYHAWECIFAWKYLNKFSIIANSPEGFYQPDPLEGLMRWQKKNPAKVSVQGKNARASWTHESKKSFLESLEEHHETFVELGKKLGKKYGGNAKAREARRALPDKDIIDIRIKYWKRQALGNPVSQKEIAKEYNVSRKTIGNIVSGKNFSDVKGPFSLEDFIDNYFEGNESDLNPTSAWGLKKRLLNCEEARDIRSLYWGSDYTLTELGSLYDVNSGTISFIVNGESYKECGGPISEQDYLDNYQE